MEGCPIKENNNSIDFLNLFGGVHRFTLFHVVANIYQGLQCNTKTELTKVKKNRILLLF